jgi:hypothetical protein
VINPETAHTEIQKNISPDTLVSVNAALLNNSPENKGKNKKRKGIS